MDRRLEAIPPTIDILNGRCAGKQTGKSNINAQDKQDGSEPLAVQRQISARKITPRTEELTGTGLFCPL